MRKIIAVLVVALALSLGYSPTAHASGCGPANDGERISVGGRTFECIGRLRLWVPV
jgi:hypothetical protein